MFFLLAFNAGVIALYFFIFAPQQDPAPPPQSEPPEVSEPAPPPVQLSDEYYSTLFSLGDAIELCSMETKSRNSNLIQLSLNELSTRYDEEKQHYLVKLDSHVGTPFQYEERSHTCEIDPKTQGVAFYREITRRTVVRPQ